MPGEGTLFVASRDALLSIFPSLRDQYAPYRSLRASSLEGTLPAMTFRFGDIQMFAGFPHIACFELEFEYGEIVLTDSDCEAIAGWWPGLRAFRIGGVASPAVSEDPPALTLRALLAFVERCPEFACPTLPMDATDVPALQLEENGRPRRYWALEELVVQDTPIESGEELGAWMAGTFPRLRKVVYDVPEDYDDDAGWMLNEWKRVRKMTTGKSSND